MVLMLCLITELAQITAGLIIGVPTETLILIPDEKVMSNGGGK